MSRHHPRPWLPWHGDARVSYQLDGDMVRVKVAGGIDGRTSEWMRLLGGDVDASVRQLLRETTR